MAARPAALVVHDLKNELGALEAGLQQLALCPDPERAVTAHRQCRDLRQRLVSFLTVYGHDGELRARCEDESPAELMRALRARGVERTDHVEVSLRDMAELPAIWFYDRRLVLMALEAALHNALRFARDQVWIGARVESGCLVFVIDDDGPGLGAAETAASTATGLGSDLCRAVAAAHGATPRESGVRLFNGPEGGARFELWLPT